MNIKKLKDCIQSAHINFLFGSGLSRPYLSTLGQIETYMALAAKHTDEDERKLIIASLYALYYNSVMRPCLPSRYTGNAAYDTVLGNYKEFLNIWNELLAARKSSLLEKSVNIFSTNIDDFVETAAESTGIEFNDGFKGHLNPIFKEDSFSNVVSRISPLYQNTAQIPVFNYLKIHGSINWIQASDNLNICLDSTLSIVTRVGEEFDIVPDSFISIDSGDTFDQVIEKAKAKIAADPDTPNKCTPFMTEYKKMMMVNPRKAKFRESVVDLHFYELMRLYSNALESASALLFCAGFSFADEHIAKITLRAANANPTLTVIVFAYNADAKTEIENNLNRCGNMLNNNIIVLSPDAFWAAQDEDYRARLGNAEPTGFDFATINKYIFRPIATLI